MDYIEKFEKSAFGLFVHFGLYSRISKGEWYRSSTPYHIIGLDN